MRAIVIGAGASGMAAALTAARRGHSVKLIERQSRAGRKLMATGNGRCNLTNTGASPEHYHGMDVTVLRSAMEAMPPAAALEFFRSIGLLTVEESGGRVYPLSNSANSVVEKPSPSRDFLLTMVAPPTSVLTGMPSLGSRMWW